MTPVQDVGGASEEWRGRGEVPAGGGRRGGELGSRNKGLLMGRQRGPGHLARDGSLSMRSVPTVLTPALGQTEVGRRVRVPAAGLSN